MNDIATDPSRRYRHPVAGLLESFPLVPVLLAPLVVLYLRTPDAFQHPDFWAEDGAIFFRQWQEVGFASILEPYNGYLHLAPRLIAALAGAAPLDQTPRLYFLASVAAALWAAGTIYLHSPAPAGSGRRLWPPLFLLPFLALSATEVLSTPTNLQWILATGLAVALLGGDPDGGGRSRLVQANTLIFVLVAGLSGPFAMFALAAAVAAALLTRQRPGRARLVLFAAVAVASAIQASMVFGHYGSGAGAVTAAKVYEAFFAILRRSMGGSVECIAISITVLIGAAAGSRLSDRDRRFRIGLLLFGFLLTLAMAIRFAAEAEVFPNGVSQRYRYIQSTMWLMLLVLMVSDPARRWMQALAGGCLVLYAVALFDGRFVRQAREPLDDWRAVVRAAERAPAVYRFPPGWSVIVEGR